MNKQIILNNKKNKHFFSLILCQKHYYFIIEDHLIIIDFSLNYYNQTASIKWQCKELGRKTSLFCWFFLNFFDQKPSVNL